MKFCLVFAGTVLALNPGSAAPPAVPAAPGVKPSAIRRVLFLGNSITLHGPKADIGWAGDWGMAASSEEKDYVHLVTRALAQHTGSTPQILVRNIADFERGYATYDVDGQMKALADAIVQAILQRGAAPQQVLPGML